MRRAWVVVLVTLAGCSGDPAPAASPSPVAVAAERVAVAATTGHAAELSGATALDPDSARLRGPHVALAVSGVGRSAGPLPDTVAGVFELPSPAVPGPGQELLLIDLTDPTSSTPTGGPSGAGGPGGAGSPSGSSPSSTGGTGGPGGGGGPSETAAPSGPSGSGPSGSGGPGGTPGPGPTAGTGDVEVVVVAGSARRVVPATALAGTLLVSVPTGAPAALEVTDAGRTQSLDLATGRRTAEVAGYYPLRTGSAEATGTPAGLVLYGAGVAGQSKGDRTASIALDRATATLQPYVEGRGWAPEGRAFLVLDATLAYDRAGAAEPDTVTVPAACFTAGPVRLAAPPLTIRGATGTARLVADVPASTAQVTLRFAFRGTVRAAAGEATFQPAGGGPQTATVTLG